MLELIATASAAEQERLLVLEATKLVDSPASEDFDRVTRLAARAFGVPIALISLVTADRQWFMSKVGLDVCETEREAAFCSTTIRADAVMVVPDATKDQRFRANRLVTGEPSIRFYAGAPLVTASGHALGSLCVIDTAPRDFSEADRALLADLATMVMRQIELTVSVGRVNEVTKLPNRAQLQSDLNDMTSISDPGQRALILMDIMGAQQVQAAVLALGVGALERFLTTIGRRLGKLLPPKVTLYNPSDTRFAFMLPAAQRAQVDAALDAIVRQMTAPFELEGVVFSLDVRCGLVAFDPATDRVVDLLRMATSALVQRTGREDRQHWFTPDFDATHRRTYALVRTIPEGLNHGEFRLVYQPKYDVAKQRYSGVEALLRWTHPVMGAIAPGEFIPAIEKTHAIHEVTQWVLDAALAQLARWQRSGLFITVAVNVSGRNLEQPGFPGEVRRACAAHGVDPRWLHIECTENVALANERIARALADIDALGVQISLDDFGIGYSNIACLNRLPIGLIKLDQSLVRPITTDFRAWTLAQSLVTFGHSLGYRVLGEGVEDAETCRLLIEAGCDALQGYHLARPLEADAILPFMRAAPGLAVLGHRPRS